MFNSPNSIGTGGNDDENVVSNRETQHSQQQYSTTEDGRVEKNDHTDEFVSPNSVHQLGIAIQAGQRATERLKYLEAHSRLANRNDHGDGSDCDGADRRSDDEGGVMKLHWEDILVEDLLGVGGFCCVCRVRCNKLHRALHPSASRRRVRDNENTTTAAGVTPANLNDDEGDNDDLSVPTSEEENWEKYNHDVSLPSSGGSSFSSLSVDQHHPEPSEYYALKCLSNKTMMSPSTFVEGAADLVGEAFYLGRLYHPNVIRIYAVSAGGTLDAFMKPGGYFLVVEAFHSILSDELNEWRRLLSGEVVRSNNESDDDSDNSIPPLTNRLMYAIDIAQAMVYLHSEDIVFRDLKTKNCGIDDHGSVKLFDFGLAREVDEQGLHPGMAGSLKSMAPETILNKVCCKASDVYAFGMLLWELCTLIVPLVDLSKPSDIKVLVAMGGTRPPLDMLEQSLATVIEDCWDEDVLKRPTFEHILGDLKRIIDTLGGADALVAASEIESSPQAAR